MRRGVALQRQVGIQELLIGIRAQLLAATERRNARHETGVNSTARLSDAGLPEHLEGLLGDARVQQEEHHDHGRHIEVAEAGHVRRNACDIPE